MDERLLNTNRNIKRNGEIIKSSIKCEWECLVCKNIWLTTPNNILSNKSGCPKCSGRQKHTNESIDNLITDRFIFRVDDYINYDTPIAWKCKLCDNTWKNSPHNIIKDNNNCPKCSSVNAGRKKSEKEENRVYKYLKNNNIKLLSTYKRIVDYYELQCNICEYKWNTTLNCVLNTNTGCPSCSKVAPLTKESINDRLIKMKNNIKLVSNIKNARTHASFECEHGHIWNATPDSVLHGSGCPTCFNYINQYIKNITKYKLTISSTIFLYFIRVTDKRTNDTFLKVGITKHKNILNRFKRYKNYNFEIITSKTLAVENCVFHEQDILSNMKIYKYLPERGFAGRTECFEDTEIAKEKILEYFSNI